MRPGSRSRPGARMARPAASFEIGGRTDEQHANRAQPPRQEVRIRQRRDAQRQIEALHKLSDPAGVKEMSEEDRAELLRLADEFGAFVRPVGRELQIRTDFEDIGPTLVWGNDLLAVSAQVHSAPNMIAGAAHYFQEKRDHRFRGLTKEPEWSGGASRGFMRAARGAPTRSRRRPWSTRRCGSSD